MFGKREGNGVSTPYVLSMRPYAHIIAKHAKKGLFYQTMPNYPFRGLMQIQVSHINQQNMLTISTSNTYPNILELIIYYNPTIKEQPHKYG